MKITAALLIGFTGVFLAAWVISELFCHPGAAICVKIAVDKDHAALILAVVAACLAAIGILGKGNDR